MRAEKALSLFLAGFPPSQSDADWDDSYRRFIHLVHDTAVTLDHREHVYGRHPSTYALVRIVCLKRVGAVAHYERQREDFDEEKRLLLAYDVWALGDRNGTQWLSFGEVINMSLGEIEKEKRQRVRRQNQKDLLLPPPHKSARYNYNLYLPQGASAVFSRWLTQLRKAQMHLRNAGQ